MMSEELKQYAERDPMELDEQGGYYFRHVLAMTAEKLHAKSDIAAELGWRDAQIDTLRAQVAALEAQIEKAKTQEPVAVFRCQYEDDGGIHSYGLEWKINASQIENGDALYLNPFPDESRGNFFIEFWCGACSTTDRKACQCRRFPEDGE